MTETVIKSELIDRLAARFPKKRFIEISDATNELLEAMLAFLGSGHRIEIRGFGTFNIREVQGKVGRNPRTGACVEVSPSNKVLFKCSKHILYKLNK